MGAETLRGEGRPLEKQGAVVGPVEGSNRTWGPGGMAVAGAGHKGRTGQGDTHTQCFIYFKILCI